MSGPGLQLQPHTAVRRRALVAAMDWGLGHATRCIPVIHTLLELDCRVVVAGSGPSSELLKEEFPSLPYIELPPYDPQYPHSSALVWKLARQLPRFLRTVSRERRVTEEVVKAHNIEIIVSDNRYGCRSARAKSVFMGHQINLRLPSGARWAEPVVNLLHERFLRKFDACWVPDWKGEESLAGELSQSGTLNIEYLGPISRFRRLREGHKAYDITFLLSGPEPQRTVFEELVFALAGGQNLKICIVRGVLDGRVYPSLPGAKVIDRAGTSVIREIMAQSALVVARAGYSTIMDLAHTGGKAVFIPTPGQPEQEYLAKWLEQKGIAGYLKQDALDLGAILETSLLYKGFEGLEDDGGRLRSALLRALI